MNIVTKHRNLTASLRRLISIKTVEDKRASSLQIIIIRLVVQDHSLCIVQNDTVAFIFAQKSMVSEIFKTFCSENSFFTFL